MTIAAPHDEIYMPPPAAGGARPVGGGLKRGLDIAVALTALILLAPLLAVIAGLVRVTMGRPVLCRQARIGFAGRVIDCYTFRTTEKGDGELTPFGLLLTQSGIAKLPQLFNVLKGEMSCVGPRPLRADDTQPSQGGAAVHFMARPGLTGEWRLAIAGGHATAFDADYATNWSMRTDIGVLFKSLAASGRSED
jgi:exopolysaccharide production protein ExoY